MVAVGPGRRTRIVPEGDEAIRAKALGWIAVRSGMDQCADGLGRRDHQSSRDQTHGPSREPSKSRGRSRARRHR